MIPIRNEDLRLLANCLSGDSRLLDEVSGECVAGTPCSNPTAAAVAKFISSRAGSEAVEPFLQQLRGALVMSTPASEPPQLCLTMPSWLRSAAFGPNVASTEVAMINVILHARSTLKLAFPFIDGASKDIFRQLEYAWRRGCNVQILCRDIYKCDGLGLADDFTTALRESRDGAACRLPISVDNSKWTFHAKVMIADELTAYVGSANLTRASLNEQAEVGVLLSDAAIIRDLRMWYSSLWSILANAEQ